MDEVTGRGVDLIGLVSCKRHPLSTGQAHSEVRRAASSVEQRPGERNLPRWRLDLGLPASRSGRKKHLSSELPGVWCSVLAARAQTRARALPQVDQLLATRSEECGKNGH